MVDVFHISTILQALTVSTPEIIIILIIIIVIMLYTFQMPYAILTFTEHVHDAIVKTKQNGSNYRQSRE